MASIHEQTFYKEVGGVEDNINKEDKTGNAIEIEEKKEEKKKATRITLHDYHLTSKNGLRTLYECVSKNEKLTKDLENPNFNEIACLSNLMKTVKDWQYSLIPKYEFEYFVERCTKLDKSKSQIPSFLSRIREIHQGILTWEQIESEFISEEKIERNDEKEEEREKIGGHIKPDVLKILKSRKIDSKIPEKTSKKRAFESFNDGEGRTKFLK